MCGGQGLVNQKCGSWHGLAWDAGGMERTAYIAGADAAETAPHLINDTCTLLTANQAMRVASAFHWYT